MYQNKGFTLIELLVVVLIIGILASVALPEYQKAVKKARLMRLAPIVKSLADAEEVYYLANGTYTASLSELDVSLPDGIRAGNTTDDGFVRLSDGTLVDLLIGSSKKSGGTGALVSATAKEGFGYYQYLENSAYPSKRICKGDTALCKSFGGVELADGWTIP